MKNVNKLVIYSDPRGEGGGGGGGGTPVTAQPPIVTSCIEVLLKQLVGHSVEVVASRDFIVCKNKVHRYIMNDKLIHRDSMKKIYLRKASVLMVFPLSHQ